MEVHNDQNLSAVEPDSLQQDYQKALLNSGIQAAKLLSELMALRIMPDPRAKDMADVALEVIRLINSTPSMSCYAAGDVQGSGPSEIESSTAQTASKLTDKEA